MSQLAKCVSRKSEKLNSDPQHPHTCNLSPRSLELSGPQTQLNQRASDPVCPVSQRKGRENKQGKAPTYLSPP